MLPFPPPLPFPRRRESLRRQPHSPTGDIGFRFRGISRWRGKRFPLSREWNRGGKWKRGEWKWREVDGGKKNIPFRRKPESLRRSRIRRRRPLQCSASRKILAVARMRFRLSPEWKVGEAFIPFARGRGCFALATAAAKFSFGLPWVCNACVAAVANGNTCKGTAGFCSCSCFCRR